MIEVLDHGGAVMLRDEVDDLLGQVVLPRERDAVLGVRLDRVGITGAGRLHH